MRLPRPSRGPDAAAVRARLLRFEVLEDRRLLSALAEEQHFVYLLNLARHDPAAYQQITALAVDLSSVAPRPPLAVNEQLMQSAGLHADEMAEHDYLDHRSPVTGLWPNQFARQQGYPLPSAWANDNNYIESVAAGDWFDRADVPLEALLVDQGVPGGEHRRHLLGVDAFYAANREIGVGYATAMDSLYGHYWTVHIARQENAGTFLTGVVYEDLDHNGRYDPGEGLPDVTVQADGSTARTNAAGGYSLAVASRGSTLLVASGPRLAVPVTGRVLVAGANVEVDIVSGVRGVYLDFAGQPTSAWTNPRERRDVSDNAVVDPLDALQVINQLNTRGSRSLSLPDLAARIQPPLLDVDGDGQLLPQDALVVINYLNRVNEAEGEQVAGSAEMAYAWLLGWPAEAVMASVGESLESLAAESRDAGCPQGDSAVGRPLITRPVACGENNDCLGGCGRVQRAYSPRGLRGLRGLAGLDPGHPSLACSLYSEETRIRIADFSQVFGQAALQVDQVLPLASVQ